jgi:hypothetical protein
MNIGEITVSEFPSGFIHESIVSIADAETYKARIEKALKDAEKRYGASCLVVYGDREHFANLHYFSGYDPRFEESLLILKKGKEPILLAGNEGFAYSEIIPYPLKRVLYQSLSLAGQPREGANKSAMEEALKEAAVGSGDKIGVIGIKYYVAEESDDPLHFLDIPHYMIKILSRFAPSAEIINVTDVMIHPEYGIRTCLDIDEMAVLELAGTKSSRSVYNVMTHLKPGISEIEASAFLRIDGDPLVAHPNLNFTWKDIKRGLVSPGNHRLHYGDAFNIGFGYRSSMVARTSMYVRGKEDIKEEWADIKEAVYKPYFKVIVTWYENLKIGVSGKEILEKIRKAVPEFDSLGIGLNPGHLIHNDEWTSSIFTEKAAYPIRNGMAIQCDIIANPSKYPGVHIEDGLIMADSDTRSRFREKHPQAWVRIEARRKLMKESLHINLSDEVLPLSDLQGCLAPGMAEPQKVLALV